MTPGVPATIIARWAPDYAGPGDGRGGAALLGPVGELPRRVASPRELFDIRMHGKQEGTIALCPGSLTYQVVQGPGLAVEFIRAALRRVSSVRCVALGLTATQGSPREALLGNAATSRRYQARGVRRHHEDRQNGGRAWHPQAQCPSVSRGDVLPARNRRADLRNARGRLVAGSLVPRHAGDAGEQDDSKTGRKRQIPLGVALVRLLRFMHRAAGCPKEGTIFRNGRRRPWDKLAFSKLFKKLAKVAGVWRPGLSMRRLPGHLGLLFLQAARLAEERRLPGTLESAGRARVVVCYVFQTQRLLASPGPRPFQAAGDVADRPEQKATKAAAALVGPLPKPRPP
jgi:hypothetical protein